MYGAFPDIYLDRMKDNSLSVANSTEGVRPVDRKGAFDFHSGGAMKPFGSRLPTGGRAGDDYLGYQGMDGASLQGITSLFASGEVG